MGPTNIALVNLYWADQAHRESQARLDGASRSVRLLERRISELNEKLRLTQAQLRENQAKVGQFDLDIKMRDEKIEKFRSQQQSAKNHKEYQAFLTEINTEKADKAKAEDDLIRVMEIVENLQAEAKDLAAQLDGEKKKHVEIKAQLASKLSDLQADVESKKAARDQAVGQVPPKALDAFERICDRWDSEAMAAMGKPDKRREEYVCMACNMSLVVDIYNRLHSRDDLVFCPNCHRLLFIPEDLTPETAIHKLKERREPRRKGKDKEPESEVAVPATRQMSAADISRSISAGEEEPAENNLPQEQQPVEPESKPQD